MKKSVIIFSAIITMAGFAAFGFVDSTTANNNSQSPIDSNNVELSYLGINGGINVNYYTGSVTEFVTAKEEIKKPNLYYMIQRGSSNPNAVPRYGRAVTKEKLQNAQTLSDVIENYPTNWISAYNSVSISTTIDGKDIEATGANATLTKKQKQLFSAASNVLIIVHYQKKNDNNQIQNRQMNVSLIVTPEMEAEYVGGYEKMISYLKENSLDKIDAKNFNHLPQPSVSFVVNQNGTIENVKLTATSRDAAIDQLLVELIKNMPKWNPAKNAEGINIKQEFVLNIGQDGC